VLGWHFKLEALLPPTIIYLVTASFVLLVVAMFIGDNVVNVVVLKWMTKRCSGLVAGWAVITLPCFHLGLKRSHDFS
jgi:hypothetical protein